MPLIRYSKLISLMCGLITLQSTAFTASPAQTSQNIKPSLAPMGLRSNEVTLVWEKPEGVRNGVVYHVWHGQELVGATARMHFTVKGLNPETEYRFQVSLSDDTSNLLKGPDTLTVRTKTLEKTISVESFGAKGDGTTLNTSFIQSAIDACPENGIVLIPKGTFVSGALFLKSNMTLQVEEGAVLQGSPALEDYEPRIRNRFEGWELDTYASLINAGKLDAKGSANVRNISIRGAGKIVGGGTALASQMKSKYGLRGRGRLICIMNADGLEIQGVTLENPPSWTLHYIYSENVSIHGVTIRTHGIHNGDGIDPDSSKNSYIFNCVFDTGDDCIAIKSGKNPEGNMIARPTENVRVMGCTFIAGHGISIGSEMSGGVRNVVVEDCVAGNLMHGFQIKATKDRGGIVENVTVRDCTLQKISILTDLPYNNDGKPADSLPIFRNFTFQNIDLTKADPAAAIIVNGYPSENRTKNILFDGIKLPDAAVVVVDQAEDVKFTNISSASGKEPDFRISRSENISK